MGWFNRRAKRLSAPGQPLVVDPKLVDLTGYELDEEWTRNPASKWPQKVMYVKRHQEFLAQTYHGHSDERGNAILLPTTDESGDMEIRVFLERKTIGRIPPQDNHRYVELVKAAASTGRVIACKAWTVTGSDGVFGVRLDLPQ